MIGCALALANVASAATSSGEDQYVEQAPNGGGNTGDNVDVVDTNGDGVVSEAEVKAAAERNEKKAKKKAKADKEDGSTGSTGAVAGTTPTPPAAASVAAAAKFGPVSQKTAIALGLLLLVGGGIALFSGSFGTSFASALGINSDRVNVKTPTES